MQNKEFKVFIDFDGTITKKDVGEEIFLKFGKTTEVKNIIEDLLTDKISSKECWVKLCESANPINQKELNKFILNFEIDISFNTFINYCKEKKIKNYILSDGFDYYINMILEKEKINDVKVFANKLSIDSAGFLQPTFPYYDSQFKSSANCKRNHIIENSGDDEYTVFIGDGNSDKETIEYCDFIFAKNDLLRHCEMQRITFFPFKNFNDVIKKIDELYKRKRLKKTHRAQLKRQQAYINE